MENRTVPKDVAAESAVLSAMMIDNYSVVKAIEILKEEYFYKTAHKIIFHCILSLFEDNIEVDLITLIDQLEKTGNLEKVGGKAYLHELSDIVLTGANIEYHARIVVEKALLRELIVTSTQIIEKSYNATDSIQELVDEAEQAIFRIAEMPNRRGFTRIGELIPGTLRSIEEIATTKSSVIGVPSGFRELDKITGGFRAGQLIVIAARPAMGKTALALNMALNAAMYHDMKVGIFTLEMAADELLMRMMSAASEVTMNNMLKGYGMDQNKILRISQVADALSRKNIYIDDNGASTVLDIRAKSRRLKAEIKGLDLIIIDYMQLMTSRRRIENRQQEIADISRSLKVLAKELGVPVIALSQLNRLLESRTDKRPILSDLRESGAIEQDADLVMFIYRDEVYHEDSISAGMAEIIIGKNRHGATGTVEVEFKKEYTCFRDKGERT